MTQDLNALYDKGDLCWLLISTVLCWSVNLRLPAVLNIELTTHLGRSPRLLVSSTQACTDEKLL